MRNAKKCFLAIPFTIPHSEFSIHTSPCSSSGTNGPRRDCDGDLKTAALSRGAAK